MEPSGPSHRSVATIRGTTTTSSHPAPAPNTPPRSTSAAIAAAYSSPSTVRAEEDLIVLELGSRVLRAGFAGDSSPKAVVGCSPDEGARAGDFSRINGGRPGLTEGEENEHRRSRREEGWQDGAFEFWRSDLRDVDLGLVGDKLDRALREAFTKYLLVDSRARKMALILDTAIPIPLLSQILDLLFHRFHAPLLSLFSTPLMSLVGAGIRSGVVVDIGWEETIVTSVCEYREVRSTRSVRAGRKLHETLYEALCVLLDEQSSADTSSSPPDAASSAARRISFAEVEEVLCRLSYARSSAFTPSNRQSAQLETVQEQDEEVDTNIPQSSTSSSSSSPSTPTGTTSVPFTSTSPPSTLPVPFAKLADAVDAAFFAPSVPPSSFDDHELPLPLLIYQHLLHLSTDVRSVCIARTVFTGGCSNILGLKSRIHDDLASIIAHRGWEPVTGKAVDQLRNNPKLTHRPMSFSTAPPEGEEPASERPAAPPSLSSDQPRDANDLIEARLASHHPQAPQVKGDLRVLHSVGPWAGASLACSLKIGAVATIEKDQWIRDGMNGASRAGDVDLRGVQRGRGSGNGSWTLGSWGHV